MIKRQHGSLGIKQREKIIHKAAILMDKKGYNGVSIQDIADLAKIHKSTFYHYFRSKSELLQTVLEKPVEEILERMNKIINDSNLSAREKLRLAIFNHLHLLEKYTHNLNIYNRELMHLPPGVKKRYFAGRKKYRLCLEQIINEMKNVTEDFKGLDSKIVTFGVLGMCNWAATWYKHNMPLKSKDISEIFYRILVQE